MSLGNFSVVPPTEPCALRLIQPLKVSTEDFSWGKGGRCGWLKNYHPCSAEMSRKSGALTYPETLGPPRPVAGHLYLLFCHKTTCFGHLLCRLSGVFYCTFGTGKFHSGFDYRFQAESCMTLLGSGHQNLHETYQCRMYSRKLLMMGREDARNMYSFMTE